MSVPYQIIATGSAGNAVLIGKHILVDCGVSFKALSPILNDIQLVLLTHKHGDHFSQAAVRRLAEVRPTVRFGCMKHMVPSLVNCGVPKNRIDVMQIYKAYTYPFGQVSPVPLTHDVPNCGWRIRVPEGKAFYATDTANLNGIAAVNYDLYLIEANYEDTEIAERIDQKKQDGVYAYERRARDQHLSVAAANDFIYRNIGQGGEYVFLHRHEEKGEKA